MSKKTTGKKSTSKAEETRADASREAAAGGPLGQAIAAVRTPVYAYVGANDLAIQAVSGSLSVVAS